MEIVISFLSQLVTSFSELGILAYVLLFSIALLDSLIVTGSFINGTIFLLLAGVMTAKGTHEFTLMAVVAAVGAILGGIISYYLGTASASYFKKRKEVTKKRMSVSKELFQKYGGFGVFVGRFLGPVSSIVAFVAGTAKVSKASFYFWNAVAGISWGVGYVTIGYTLGGSFDVLTLLG